MDTDGFGLNTEIVLHTASSTKLLLAPFRSDYKFIISAEIDCAVILLILNFLQAEITCYAKIRLSHGR
jgi:hypothetical protein